MLWILVFCSLHHLSFTTNVIELSRQRGNHNKIETVNSKIYYDSMFNSSSQYDEHHIVTRKLRAAEGINSNLISPTLQPTMNTLILPDRETCSVKYGYRGYIRQNEIRPPPLLYSFPGAGNTWVRLLIEYSTGILTGSLHDDLTLLPMLPGQLICNQSQSVIKAHPNFDHFSGLRQGSYRNQDTRDKCIERGDVRRFQRVAVLLRDIYESIWSEYQRRVTMSHTGGILRNEFIKEDFEGNALYLSRAAREMFEVDMVGCYDIISNI